MANLLSPAVIKNSGAGKAFQAVAQSTAIAIGDGTTYLRNIETISSTAAAVAMAKFLETENPIYLTLVPIAMGLVPTATASYAAIGAASVAIANAYPK